MSALVRGTDIVMLLVAATLMLSNLWVVRRHLTAPEWMARMTIVSTLFAVAYKFGEAHIGRAPITTGTWLISVTLALVVFAQVWVSISRIREHRHLKRHELRDRDRRDL